MIKEFFKCQTENICKLLKFLACLVICCFLALPFIVCWLIMNSVITQSSPPPLQAEAFLERSSVDLSIANTTQQPDSRLAEITHERNKQ